MNSIGRRSTFFNLNFKPNLSLLQAVKEHGGSLREFKKHAKTRLYTSVPTDLIKLRHIATPN